MSSTTTSSSLNNSFFKITYDQGDSDQILNVSHELYHSNSAFQKNIKYTKCLNCDLEFNFVNEIQKEPIK